MNKKFTLIFLSIFLVFSISCSVFGFGINVSTPFSDVSPEQESSVQEEKESPSLLFSSRNKITNNYSRNVIFNCTKVKFSFKGDDIDGYLSASLTTFTPTADWITIYSGNTPIDDSITIVVKKNQLYQLNVDSSANVKLHYRCVLW